MLNKIKFIVDGSEVRRFHTIRTVKEETVGHHSLLVAMICRLLSTNCSNTLLLAALTHDLAESVTGDIPAPVKARMSKAALGKTEEEILDDIGLGYVKELTIEERRVLTLADRLAGLVFCRQEISMGNTLIKPCLYNYIDLVWSMAPFSNEETIVIEAVSSL
jgi:5'-deoxynucleotidase YfbR-like HD superfamily hydrolase